MPGADGTPRCLHHTLSAIPVAAANPPLSMPAFPRPQNRTYKRKHVDWEISANLIHRPNNPRCGLIGLLLPTHPDYRKSPEHRNPRFIPPRLARNIEDNNPFAIVYDWPSKRVARKVLPKIHTAYLRREKTPWPDDGLEPFANNHRGPCNKGWQN